MPRKSTRDSSHNPQLNNLDQWVSRWKRMMLFSGGSSGSERVRTRASSCDGHPHPSSVATRHGSSGMVGPPRDGSSQPSTESLVSLITGSSTSALTSGLGLSGSPYLGRHSRHHKQHSHSSAASSVSHSSFDDSGGFFRRQISYRRSARSVLTRNTTSQSPGHASLIASLNLHPMQFEVPCIDLSAPLVGREWLYHELFEILVRPGVGDANAIRGAVIHGCVGTGKTAALFQLANQAPSHANGAGSGAKHIAGTPLGAPNLFNAALSSGVASGAANGGLSGQQLRDMTSGANFGGPAGSNVGVNNANNPGCGATAADHTVSTDSGFVQSSSRLSLPPYQQQQSQLSSAVCGNGPQSAGLSSSGGFVVPHHPSEYCKCVADQVIAYHFCQVDVADTCHLSKFLTNLVAMLATAPQLTAYGDYLARNPSLLDLITSEPESLRDPVMVFRRVIVEPLRNLRKCNKIPTSQNYLVIIDGLDEAEFHRPEYGDSIGSFIVGHFTELPSWIRIVMSVKTQSLDLVRGFPCHKINLDNIVMDERLYRDVEDYIAFRVENSAEIQSNICGGAPAGGTQAICLPPDSHVMIGRFVEHATSLCKGSFLYLKLMLNLIERGHLVIKSSTSFKVLPINLSEVFLLLFNLKFPSVRAFERIAGILNICLASLYPLSAQDIFEALNAGFVEHFLTWEEFCERLLSLFDFLVQREDDTFVLFHPAFRDWLIRRDDGESPKFLCDASRQDFQVRYGHSLLAFRLSRMPGGLSPDGLMELGHHILKAHIYKQMTRDMRRVSSRDAQAYWVTLSAPDIDSALISDRNVFCPNTKVSRLILLAGANPDATTRFYNSAPMLCVAAQHGHIEMVALLLEFGADVCGNGQDGLSALMHASRAGHLDTVQLLHQHGAKLSQVDGSNHCALVHAAATGHTNICSFLLQCDWSEMTSSALSDQRHSVANETDWDDQRSRMQASAYASGLRQQAAQQAFVVAASAGQTKACQFMLEFADVNMDEPDVVTKECALSLACKHAHKDTVQFLLTSRATISFPHSAAQSSPLVQAVSGGCWEIVSGLLARGADVNAERNSAGQTPLMMAALNGHIGVMELLLSRDADVQAVDKEGKSAVTWACIKNQVPCVTLLLDRGARIEQCDHEGKAAIHHASINGGKHLIQVLLDRGASLDHADSSGMRPLDLAIYYRKLDLLTSFLRKGAKLGPTTWTMAEGKCDVLIVLLRKLFEDGSVLYRRNLFKEAAQRFQYALKKFPPSVDVDKQKLFMELKHDLLINLARVKRKHNDLTGAIDLINQSLLLKPSSFEGHFVRARCYKELNDLKAAYLDVCEALRILPSNRDARLMYSLLQDELKAAGLLGSVVASSGALSSSGGVPLHDNNSQFLEHHRIHGKNTPLDHSTPLLLPRHLSGPKGVPGVPGKSGQLHSGSGAGSVTSVTVTGNWDQHQTASTSAGSGNPSGDHFVDGVRFRSSRMPIAGGFRRYSGSANNHHRFTAPSTGAELSSIDVAGGCTFVGGVLAPIIDSGCDSTTAQSGSTGTTSTTADTVVHVNVHNNESTDDSNGNAVNIVVNNAKSRIVIPAGSKSNQQPAVAAANLHNPNNCEPLKSMKNGCDAPNTFAHCPDDKVIYSCPQPNRSPRQRQTKVPVAGSSDAEVVTRDATRLNGVTSGSNSADCSSDSGHVDCAYIDDKFVDALEFGYGSPGSAAGSGIYLQDSPGDGSSKQLPPSCGSSCGYLQKTTSRQSASVGSSPARSTPLSQISNIRSTKNSNVSGLDQAQNPQEEAGIDNSAATASSTSSSTSQCVTRIKVIETEC